MIAGTALALCYERGPGPCRVGESGSLVDRDWPQRVVRCGTPITLRVTVLNATAQPIAGQPVGWAITSTPSSKDTVNTTPTITNASGVATTTVTLACVVGQRIVTATGDDVSFGAVLSVTSGGLPVTATTLDGSPVGNLPIAPILAVLAVLAGSGIILRRFILGLR